MKTFMLNFWLAGLVCNFMNLLTNGIGWWSLLGTLIVALALYEEART
jgi:hypothetical protein